VHEVEGDVRPGQCTVEAVALEHVSAHDLGAALGEVGRAARVAGERANRAAVLDQRPREQAADVAGRAGNQDAALSRSDRR
jgi:hypothetical protein